MMYNHDRMTNRMAKVGHTTLLSNASDIMFLSL